MANQVKQQKKKIKILLLEISDVNTFEFNRESRRTKAKTLTVEARVAKDSSNKTNRRRFTHMRGHSYEKFSTVPIHLLNSRIRPLVKLVGGLRKLDNVI